MHVRLTLTEGRCSVGVVTEPPAVTFAAAPVEVHRGRYTIIDIRSEATAAAG